jgi:hypothetical protein
MKGAVNALALTPFPEIILQITLGIHAKLSHGTFLLCGLYDCVYDYETDKSARAQQWSTQPLLN